jgi:colicin import membrane protein
MDDDMRHTMVLDAGQDTRKVAAMFAVSALCHLVFFVLMTIVPGSFTSSYRLAPRAISVDLVSLPAGEPAPPAPATEAAPAPEMAPEAPAAVPEAVALPSPKPEPVPIAPKPAPEKVVQSLKKKTLKKEVVKETVVQKPTPPKPAKSLQNEVSKAIESMRQKVASQERTRSASGAGGGSTIGGTGSSSGGGGGGGAAVLSRIENYRIEAALAVAQNWAFSQQLASADEQLETKITFRILPNGEITDIKIVQPSGNRYLDESAYRAVRKASPVAPHPEGINQPYIEVGVKATPSGFR